MLARIYIFIYLLYRFLSIIYQLCIFLVETIDNMVEAIMIRTIYRLSDSQKYIMMHVLILVGVGLVKEYSP